MGAPLEYAALRDERAEGSTGRQGASTKHRLAQGLAQAASIERRRMTRPAELRSRKAPPRTVRLFVCLFVLRPANERSNGWTDGRTAMAGTLRVL